MKRKLLILGAVVALVATAAFAGVLANPQTWTYTHPNFQGQSVNVSLNGGGAPGFLDLSATGTNGATGYAQFQFQDNGTVVIRVHLSSTNLFHVLILDDNGILLQQ